MSTGQSDDNNRFDDANGLGAETMYDTSQGRSGEPVFIRDADGSNFVCEALNLSFGPIHFWPDRRIDFALSDLGGGPDVRFFGSYESSPQQLEGFLTASVQTDYKIGNRVFGSDDFTVILSAAFKAWCSRLLAFDMYRQAEVASHIEFLPLEKFREIYDTKAVTPEPSAPVAVASPEAAPVTAPVPDAVDALIETAEPLAERAKVVPVKKRFRPFRAILFVIAGFFAFSILSVAIHRYVPVPVTILMLERVFEGQGIDHRWVGASKISDNLKAAVIASEDSRFCSHDGFDYDAIKKAEKYNATHKKKHGASTISQQTAKNVFLWPDRTWIRKGFEVWYTFLIEHMWPKDRIMTVYLNSVEWGPGIYGAEAASQHWFHHSAATLSRAEAAKLAAILPSPLKWKAVGSGKYVAKRSGSIQSRANVVANDGYDACAVD